MSRRKYDLYDPRPANDSIPLEKTVLTLVLIGAAIGLAAAVHQNWFYLTEVGNDFTRELSEFLENLNTPSR